MEDLVKALKALKALISLTVLAVAMNSCGNNESEPMFKLIELMTIFSPLISTLINLKNLFSIPSKQ